MFFLNYIGETGKNHAFWVLVLLVKYFLLYLDFKNCISQVRYTHLNISFKKCWAELPWWLSGKESSCWFRRHKFNPWSRKLLHAVEQLSHICHNCWACSLEPRSYNCWKPSRRRAHALQQEKENTSMRSLRTSTGASARHNWRKAWAAMKTAQPKINK